MTIEERVSSGIKLLDTKKPGWRDIIDWGELDMSKCTSCILGQLFNADYIAANKELFGYISGDEDVEYGFEVSNFECEDSESYNELEKAWYELAFKADILVTA